MFFTLARQSLSVVKAGSLANAAKTNDAKKNLSEFVQKLAAFGQEDGAASEVYDLKSGEKFFTVDLKSAEKFVTDMRLKIDSLSTGMINSSQVKLQKAISTTLDLINTVPTDNEQTFRASMKQTGTKLAGKQEEIKNALELLKRQDPEVERKAQEVAASSQDLSDSASGQELTSGALYRKGQITEDKCTEFTLIFVAFTLYRNPMVRAKNTTADTLRMKLASCLRTRDALSARSGIFVSDLQNMDELIKSFSAESASSS